MEEVGEKEERAGHQFMLSPRAQGGKTHNAIGSSLDLFTA